MLKWSIFVAKLELTGHNGPNILIIYNNGNGNVDNVEMAFVDIRLIQANGLKPSARVTFLTVGG
ncbi:hypothetical protein D3C71_2230270 [compost metagenome]